MCVSVRRSSACVGANRGNNKLVRGQDGCVWHRPALLPCQWPGEFIIILIRAWARRGRARSCFTPHPCTPPPSAMQLQPTATTILAGRLFDSHTGGLRAHRLITTSSDSGLITDVREFEDTPLGLAAAGVDLRDPNTIDLRGQTVLPGFVDAHVHCKRR